MKNVTIGSDPEIFLFDTQAGKFVSAIPFCEGTKEHPFRLENSGFRSLHHDNVALEVNINPVKNKKDFVDEIVYMLNYVKEYLPNHLEYRVCSSVEFDANQLDCKEAQEFGCAISFDAWTESFNQPPEGAETPLRTCGGHIHIGYDDPDLEQSINLIKAMDLYLGVPSVLMDGDAKRREMYGKAGDCRVTNYGVEYRSLSNFWLNSIKLMGWAYDNTMAAIEFASNNQLSVKDNEEIPSCINENNIELAKELVNKYKLQVYEASKNKKKYRKLSGSK